MSFHKDFLWGATSAATQVEGAYDEDGKGLTVSDVQMYTRNLDRTKLKKEGGGTLAAIKQYAHGIDDEIDEQRRLSYSM